MSSCTAQGGTPETPPPLQLALRGPASAQGWSLEAQEALCGTDVARKGHRVAGTFIFFFLLLTLLHLYLFCLYVGMGVFLEGSWEGSWGLNSGLN